MCGVKPDDPLRQIENARTHLPGLDNTPEIVRRVFVYPTQDVVV